MPGVGFMLNFPPGVGPGAGGLNDYIIKSLGYKPVALWALDDATGSQNARDYSVNKLPATPSNVMFGQPGYETPLTSGLFVPGSSSYINVYSTLLSSLFDADEFTMMTFMKPASSSFWTDGVIRFIGLSIFANANNYAVIQKNSAANQLIFAYKAGGTLKQNSIGVNSGLLWYHLAISVSKQLDEVRSFVNGVQVGSTLTGLGNWAASLSATQTLIGALSTSSNANTMDGSLQLVGLYPWLTAAQIKDLADMPNLITFGDSITAGFGASDDSHKWANIVAASKNWLLDNQGISDTILQNTPQNAVSTIGAAADNNGRDTYVTRIVNRSPTYVVIMYGLNDLRLNDASITVSHYQNDLSEVVDGLLANGISATKITLCSPPYMNPSYYASYSPYNAGSVEKHEAYVSACAAVAAAKGTRYVDIYTAMKNGGGNSLISADGTHPNDSGHAVIAQAVLSVV